MGRPSKYDVKFLDTAARMYASGATDVEVADELGVARATLYNWQHQHPEFLDVARMAKEAADTRVERSLYNRAVGYEFDSVKIFTYEGEPVVVPYREHIAPDPTAAFNWLKNRKPADWRDRREVTGAEGGPIEALVKVAFVRGKEDDHGT
jgi:hypothetical protein